MRDADRPGGAGASLTGLTSTAVAHRAKPLGNYPHARQAGDLVFVSGTTARQPDGSVAGVTRAPDGTVHRDAAVQTRIVIRNIEATLAMLGATLANCVDVTVFLTNMADFASYNQIYGEFFDAATGPARTTVGVSSLPHPDMVVEMKVIAMLAPGAG